MKRRFARAARAYDAAEEDRFRDAVALAFGQVYARNENLELHPKAGLVLSAPDGSRWRLAVADDGTLSASPA